MLVAIVVGLVGLAGIVLGWLQLSGALPMARRVGGFSAYMNIFVGFTLVALAALRYQGLM